MLARWWKAFVEARVMTTFIIIVLMVRKQLLALIRFYGLLKPQLL